MLARLVAWPPDPRLHASRRPHTRRNALRKRDDGVDRKCPLVLGDVNLAIGNRGGEMVGPSMAGDGVFEMSQPLPLYAHDLFQRADQYRRAAKILSEMQPEPPYNLAYPMYFSLSHALELYFKAFLVLHGMTKKETKQADIRHSPLKLYNLCQNAGLVHIDMLEHLALQIEEMNSDFDFRYPTGYRLHLPTMSLCLPVLDELHETLTPIISDARGLAQLQWAADTRHLQGHKIRWSD